MMPNLILTFKNGLDRPIPIYLRISAISQASKPILFGQPAFRCCYSLRYINASLKETQEHFLGKGKVVS